MKHFEVESPEFAGRPAACEQALKRAVHSSECIVGPFPLVFKARVVLSPAQLLAYVQ